MAKASRDDLQRAIERVEKIVHCTVAGDKVREPARIEKSDTAIEEIDEDIHGDGEGGGDGGSPSSTPAGQFPRQR